MTGGCEGRAMWKVLFFISWPHSKKSSLCLWNMTVKSGYHKRDIWEQNNWKTLSSIRKNINNRKKSQEKIISHYTKFTHQLTFTTLEKWTTIQESRSSSTVLSSFGIIYFLLSLLANSWHCENVSIASLPNSSAVWRQRKRSTMV